MKKQQITNNIANPNNDLEILKANFANCFDKNGDFDFDKFKKELQCKEIDFSKESYGMDWLGKSYARLLASDPATTLLKEDKDWNEKLENKNSENLLLKGDNLEVLKHLSNAYHEQVKMIYIDPPYNTGSDGFVYADDRKFTVAEFQKLSGVDEEKAKKILSFVNSKSNSHSAWLTFMYPRLYIAKQLLKDDGVIFVSIDDNEVAQLRILMDEVFGEENFVGVIPTVMNLKGNQDNFGFADTHEYFLAYSKCKVKCLLFNFNIDEENVLDDWQEDEYGLYKKADGLKRTGDDAYRNSRPKGWFPIFITPENDIYVTDNDEAKSKADTIVYPINEGGEELSWSWGKQKITKESYNLVITEARGGGKSIYKKQRPQLGDLPTKKPKSFFYKPEYSTSTATTLLKNLFGKKIFKGPKPAPFVKDLIIIGSNANDLVLDFFAGSGTTGDAVMQLNAEDRANGKEGNRKYILVQLPEAIDPKKNKTAYDFVKDELKVSKPTIFEITKERLIRAGKKIQAEQQDKKDLFAGDNKQNFGFKIFKTMPIWEDYDFEAETFDPQAALFDESKLTNEDIQTLLTTWKTYDNIPLTVELQKIDLSGYTGHYSDKKLYLMDKGFKTEHLKKLLEELDSNKNFSPASIIVFGYHFESKALREIAENVASYANKKKLDIDFITRY